MYFSNGNKATFARYPDSTDCINVILGEPINFMVGSLDELRHEWRVGEKRLYEVGIPGRYNKLGEWKPIIYPGKPDTLKKDACSLSEDDDVRGSLFYMMCTGHQVIEFVVKSNIELPHKYICLGDRLYLWKCLPLTDDQTVWIYDGWLQLESVDPDYIRSAIAMIGIAINRIAFTYDIEAYWRVKYRMTVSSRSCAEPSKADLDLLKTILDNFPNTEDAIILDSAIDWYNRGRLSRDPFAAFLCYYIALESVAIAIADGEADLGLKYSKDDSENRNKKRIKCIQEKLDKIYSDDPIRFVKESYFDCVLSLKEKTRRVAEMIFGEKHKYVNSLFVKHNGYSLSDIRGKLAHGKVTLRHSKDDENLVRSRLYEIADISKEFLARIILGLKPKDTLPSWSRQYYTQLLSADPRTTLFATDEKVFPTKDWRIRPEWCE